MTISIGGDSTEAHASSFFLEPEARNGARLPIFGLKILVMLMLNHADRFIRQLILIFLVTTISNDR